MLWAEHGSSTTHKNMTLCNTVRRGRPVHLICTPGWITRMVTLTLAVPWRPGLLKCGSHHATTTTARAGIRAVLPSTRVSRAPNFTDSIMPYADATALIMGNMGFPCGNPARKILTPPPLLPPRGITDCIGYKRDLLTQFTSQHHSYGTPALLPRAPSLDCPFLCYRIHELPP